MRSKTALLLLIATLLLIAALVIFGITMSMFKWDFKKLSTEKYETNTHEISDTVNAVILNTSTADIFFAPSEDGVLRIECYENAKEKHAVSVEDGTLKIERENEKNWFDYIGFSFASPKIKVYLPASEYDALRIDADTSDVEISEGLSIKSIDISVSTGDVFCYSSASETIRIETSTGDISLENVLANNLDLTVSTGRISATDVLCENDVSIVVSTGKSILTNVSCNSLISRGSTGDISLTNVIAKEKFSIIRSTGDVEFKNSDAREIYVETDTGDVEGSLLTSKIFVIETSTGDKDVPKSTEGGICEITTSTGDIKITIEN